MQKKRSKKSSSLRTALGENSLLWMRLIFNLEKQQMDNHTAVGLPSQAYHISTAGKCSQESSEMCMFGSQVNDHRTAVHFFPPPHSHPAGTTPRDRNQCQRIFSSVGTGVEGDPAAISTDMAALKESLPERGIYKLLPDVPGRLPLVSVKRWV